MAIGQGNQFPNIDIQLMADGGKLIGESNIHITEAVLSELGHFSSASSGGYTITFYYDFVELAGHFGALGRHTANHAIIFD